MIKKLLLFLSIPLFTSCDNIDHIMMNNLESGHVFGYTNSECVALEYDCLMIDGEFSFGFPFEDPFMCVCSWGGENDSI